MKTIFGEGEKSTILLWNRRKVRSPFNFNCQKTVQRNLVVKVNFNLNNKRIMSHAQPTPK